MRIVQLITQQQRRGAQVFAGMLSTSLARRGHDVALVGLYAAEEPVACDGASVVDLGGAPGIAVRPRVVAALRDYLASARPDVVQANGSDTLKYSALAKRLLGARWPLVYRNASVSSEWLRYPMHRYWVRWLLRSVDHVASVGDEARRDFADTFDFPRCRLSTVRGGMDVAERHDPAEARRLLASITGASTGDSFLIHVGSFTPEKNHVGLLSIFQRLESRRPDLHLVLVGDGPLRLDVERRVHALQLTSNVHLLGSRSDAVRLMAGADLLLLPSRIEGIPGVVLEAATQGIPTIATDVGATAEAIVPDATGVLVPFGETGAFVDAVEALLDDPMKRRRMGAAARELMTQRYDMDLSADAFERLYEGLVNAHAD